MADENRNVKVNLAFALDQSTATRVAAAIEAMGKKGQEAAQKTTGTKGALDGLQQAAGKLQQVGLIITGAAGGLSTAMLVSARGYAAQVGTAEQASRRWLAANKSLEQSQLRIGRAITTAAVPAMERVAELAEKAAAFAEKNPKLVTAGVGLIGGAAAGGAALTGLASVISSLTKLAALFQAGGLLSKLLPAAGTAATAAGGAAAGEAVKAASLGGAMKAAGLAGGGAMAIIGPILSALAGIPVGAGLYDLFRDKKTQASAGTIGGQMATVAAFDIGNLVGKGPEFAKFMGELTGAIERTGTAASSTSQGLDNTADQISAYHSYMRQRQEAERSYQRQLMVANRDFQRQMTIAEEDYLKGRQRAMRDFTRSEKIAEADYYRSRRLAARDYNIEMQRTEYDHQKELRRSREDHEWRLRRIIMEGDGMAFWEENRQYELQRSRGEEDFNLQLSRRQEDYARQRADQEKEFAIQRARRLEEFEISRKDQEYDYQLQRKRSKEQFAIQLADMAYQHQEESRLRRQALLDQLRDLQGGLERETILRREFTKIWLQDLEAAKAAALRGTNLLNPTGARSSGGYIGPGTYQTHANEYVLNAGTTEAAERLAGGRLTQESILASMAAGGAGSGKQIIYNDYRTFGQGVSQADRLAIRQDTLELMEGVINGTAL